MSGLYASMEGKLAFWHPSHQFSVPRVRCWIAVFVSLVSILILNTDGSAEATSSFSLVVFVCVWKRPLLTNFVLSHYDQLRDSLLSEGVHLHLYVVGSDSVNTSILAQRFSAAYAVHPNRPLGAKHDKGLQSLRNHYINEVQRKRMAQLPDAVAVVGSDDIINRAFFLAIRDLMSPSAVPRSHMVGLRDIFFYDLRSRQLVYTKGYRSFQTKISSTLGCGRVYSWSLLNVLDWHLWDVDREHGLDQSATRNVMRKVPLIEEISTALLGRRAGIFAVDIKSDGYKAGTNIWKFTEVVQAVRRNGRFHDFDYEKDDMLIRRAFAGSMFDNLDVLRSKMERGAES